MKNMVPEPTGILIVDKPPLLTSHDVVDEIRRLSGTRRVGHCGTLDPIGTGVLVIMVGRATRLAEYLPVDPKEYEVEMILGLETDTYDITGKVVSEKKCSATDEEIKKALEKYAGTFLQVPPMVSAKKVRGVPLYKLARKGVEIERPPKEVTVYQLQVLEILRNDRVKVRFKISCSKGTYLRAICHDAGKDLGCGGALSGLRRTRSGLFTIDEAKTLDELEALSREGRLVEALIPPHEALRNYKRIIIRQGYVARVANGEPIQLRMVKGLKFDIKHRETVVLIDEKSRFLGLARWIGDLARKPVDIVARPFRVMVS